MGYTRVDAYLSKLPEGLKSYPDMVCKGSVFRQFCSDLPFGSDLSRLPPEVATLVKVLPAPSAWVSEVQLCALMLGRMEHLGQTEQQFIDWCYEQNKKLLNQPLNRLLMLVATPELLLRGVGSRFATFHRGITANALPKGKGDWSVLLTSRPGLVPEVVLRAYATAFLAGMEGTGAKGVKCELVDQTDSHGTFRISWSS